MCNNYCPINEIEKLEAEFLTLQMIGADHETYTNRFNELTPLVPHLVTPESKRIGRYIWGLPHQIRGIVKSSMPTTFQQAVVMAATQADEMVRKLGVSKPNDNKRKWNEFSPERKPSGGSIKNVGGNRNRSFSAVVKETKPYLGRQPLCPKCNYHHVGDCWVPTCFNYKQKGHTTRTCKDTTSIAASTAGNQRLCYECGDPNHFKNACPRLKNKQSNTTRPARGRAFTMNAEAARKRQ